MWRPRQEQLGESVGAKLLALAKPYFRYLLIKESDGQTAGLSGFSGISGLI